MSKVDTTPTMTMRQRGLLGDARPAAMVLAGATAGGSVQAAALGSLTLVGRTWTMQDEEPAPGTLPKCRHLTPLQVVNWIAFKHAADRDLSGLADGARRWEVSEVGNGYNRATLAALRELAGGPAIWTPPASAADTAARYCLVPKWMHAHRTLARLLVRDRGTPAADLAALLVDELDATEQRRDKAEQARRDLLAALATGKVQAIGRDPVDADGQAPGDFQPIPPLRFKTPEFVFYAGGSVTYAGGAILAGKPALVMRDVQLNRGQVSRAWPAKPMPCRPTRKAVPPAVLDATLRAWIGTLPTKKAKRDVAVAWLAHKEGCSRDTAREAYTRLPESMKCKPGKPAGS